MPLAPAEKLAGPAFVTATSGQVELQTAVVIVIELGPALPAGMLPPVTVAVFTTLGTAAAVGSTVTVIELGFEAPALITVELVHVTCVVVDAEQFHPVPVGVPTIVTFAGIVSFTV